MLYILFNVVAAVDVLWGAVPQKMLFLLFTWPERRQRVLHPKTTHRSENLGCLRFCHITTDTWRYVYPCLPLWAFAWFVSGKDTTEGPRLDSSDGLAGNALCFKASWKFWKIKARAASLFKVLLKLLWVALFFVILYGSMGPLEKLLTIRLEL